jgi:phosphoribosylaminoimidazole-succinocarboxamide synthase
VTTPLFESSITSLPLLNKGKVRDIYAVDADKLLIVTSDRLSAFDVILPDPIPRKGEVLTAVANFWFEKLGHIVPNQLTGIDPESRRRRKRARAGPRPFGRRQAPQAAADRSRRARLRHRLRLEGLSGNRRHLRHRPAGRPENGAEAAVADLHPGHQGRSRRSRRKRLLRATAQANCDATLAEPSGTGKTGAQLCAEARDAAIRLYEEAAAFARDDRGIIIADTKFEFGIDAAGTLHLIDEALTPDSSRFWPADQLRRKAATRQSYDKQYVRDYLETLDWGKSRPRPQAAGRCHRPHQRQVHRSLRATHRPALLSPPGLPLAVSWHFWFLRCRLFLFR